MSASDFSVPSLLDFVPSHSTPATGAARPCRSLPAIPRGECDSAELAASRWRLLDMPAPVRDALLDPYALAALPCYQRNIENYIGTAKIPIGLAGPLRVQGVHADGDYWLPLATTEATLVASYSRGARLITEAGGCQARLLAEGVGRAPGFAFASLAEAHRFAAWVEDSSEVLRHIAESTTRYGRLTGLSTTVEGNHVYLDLEFHTGDAAGQNMVTIATDAVCRYLRVHAPVKPRYAFLEANHSGDKKASARSLQRVRGRRVSAEVTLSAELVRARLHADPERMVDYWRMGALGGVLSGTLGVQGHYANGLAALYIACGQDVACVAESAVGVTRLELDDAGALYTAVTLPSLVVGTVGGGTGLPSQQACLRLLGLEGPGHASALAELCAGLALAGELSLIGALCADEFARAHRQFARGGSSDVSPQGSRS